MQIAKRYPNRQTAMLFAVAVVTVCVLFILNITEGSVHIPLSDVFATLGGKTDNEAWHYIVVESRLPQAVTAVLCGASLAICGLMLQTAFSNPLAGPSIFGINSGASMGVAIVILLLNGSIATEILSVSGFVAIIAGALVGAGAVIAILLLCSQYIRNKVALLIIGIMIGYISSAAISILNFVSTEQGVTTYVMWGMGNFGSVSMQHLPVFASVTFLAVMCSMLLIKPLNALLLGESYAENLGFSTKKTRFYLLLMTGIQTAVTTAYCGPIAFIGLAVPHIARMLLHTDDHAVLMPATALTGSIIALLCNLVCVLPTDGSIIPLNAVTPMVGAPVIIYVVIRQTRHA